ncbi:MAG: heavy metal-binding domain-containing protein [Oscillospiraceae bacterium]|nr:heavy metal-binding domain-containing protein [Oscillospiraceae bacterium]
MPVKAKVIARKYGFDPDEFEQYCIRSKDIQTGGGREVFMMENDVEKAVESFSKIPGKKRIPIKENETSKDPDTERRAQLKAEREAARKLRELRKTVIVTTADLHVPYDIIGPVFYQLNDAGLGGAFREIYRQYEEELNEWEAQGQSSNDKGSTFETLGAVVNLISIIGGGMQDRDLLGGAHSAFDKAFYIATQELKNRALLLGGNAIVGMRQDIDLDTNGFQHFYLQMYGTAVKIK